MNELMRPGSDWPAAARAMDKIIATTPALADEPRKHLLEMLRLALAPSRAKPGSVEAEIDALVECTKPGSVFEGLSEPDPHYAKLLRRGFEAVPALLDHLDDQRLTRSIMAGFNNFPTMPRGVGEIVADLLQAIAGEELSRGWLERQLGQGIDKTTVEKWWAKAQRVGEEAYVRAHVLPRGKKAQDPEPAHLAIIETRYPKHLPELYGEVLTRRPEVQSWSLTEAIGRSALPREEKIALLLRGAAHASLSHQRPAISALRKLDPAAADAALLEVIAKLPIKTSTEVWTSDASGVANLVMESDAPAVWAALLAAAKKAHVSLRLEWMNPMNYDYVKDRQRDQRLHFLAQFLDDETVRVLKENSKLYGGPCAAFTFPRISVRDFAAMQIASILELPEDPKPDWSPHQWAALRTKVKEATVR